MKKIVRITTVPISLKILLKGQLKFMNNHFEIVGLTSSGREVHDVIQNEGIRVIEVELTRSITPLKDLSALFKVYRILKKEKPFIVHSHTPKAGTIGMLAALLARVPHRLHTIAGLPLLESKGLKRKLLDFVEKITYSCATMIYPNSHGLKDIIIANNYVKKQKLKVIGNGSSNGIDIDHFCKDRLEDINLNKLKDTLGINENDFVYIFVGRFVTDKGLNELISAFKRIENKSVKLLLVGTFEHALDPLFEETILEIKNNDRIINVGWQEDVRPYFMMANALVFPSYREGFPNVVMQAGALELPSIVTNINGCNEIIEHEKNGLIIPPKNEEALFLALQKLINDTHCYNQMTANAREIITKNYRRELVWESLLKEYQSLH